MLQSKVRKTKDKSYFLYDLIPIVYERQKIRNLYKNRFVTIPTKTYKNPTTKNAKVLNKPQLIVTKTSLKDILIDLQSKRTANTYKHRNAIKAVEHLLQIIYDLEANKVGNKPV